jgi:hypothetical protein
MEEGGGVRLLKIAVAILGFVAVAMFYDVNTYKNFSTQEAMDQAQVARNLAEGNGFTTQFIRPFSLYLLQKQSPGNPHDWLKQPVPDVSNPPVYPTMLAGLMKTIPFQFAIPEKKTFSTYQPERWIAFFNQLLFFVAAFLLFKLAQRLFDSSVAWLTTALFVGTELFWRFSVSGLSTMLLVVIFLMIIWCLLLIEQQDREEPQAAIFKTIFLALATGALVAMGGLTRYSFAWLIVPVILFFGLFLTRSRLAICLAAAVSFLVLTAPWLVRNYNLTGTLFGTASYAMVETTPPLTENRLERSLNPEIELRKLTLSDYVRKFLVNTREIVQSDLPKLGGSWVSAFFLAGLLVRFRNPTLSRLRIFLLSSLVLFVIVQAMGKTHLSADSPEVNSENLLVILAPLVFAFGIGLYFILLDQIVLPAPEMRYAVNGFFLLVACAPLLFTFLPPRTYTISYPPYYPPIIQETASWMKEKELIMSDIPWAVAWYGQRQAMPLTLNCHSAFLNVSDDFKTVQAVYLTPRTMDSAFLSHMVKGDESWGQFVFDCLAQGEVPTGFPLKKSPSGFLPDQLFLSDRERWKFSPH